MDLEMGFRQRGSKSGRLRNGLVMLAPQTTTHSTQIGVDARQITPTRKPLIRNGGNGFPMPPLPPAALINLFFDERGKVLGKTEGLAIRHLDTIADHRITEHLLVGTGFRQLALTQV